MDEEKRNQIIQDLLNEGYSLSDVQAHLADEYNETMTYMDLRLIAAELDVDWEKQEPAEPEQPIEDVTQEPTGQEQTTGDESAGAGGTQVTVSKVVRPGAALSGDVVFASGAKAEWYVDQYGRLGINPHSDSDKPTEQDLQEFQEELQKKVAGQ